MQWMSPNYIYLYLYFTFLLLLGPKGDWPSEDWKTGWSFHFGPGSVNSRTHWWQLTTSSDYTIQRNASSWVHTHPHTHTGSGNCTTRTACLILFLLYTAELVAKLYEAAVKKVPLSEEYHSHLFMAYARVGEYKKMQQVRKFTSIIPCKHANMHD